MYIPSNPKIVNGILEDGLIRRWAFWLPVILVAILIYLVPLGPEYLEGDNRIFSALPVYIFPSIEAWADKSLFPETTRVIFSFFVYSSLYYAVLMARWDKYKESFINDPNPYRRRFKPLIVVFYLSLAILLFSFALPVEEKCMRMCIHESRAIQIFYAFLISMCSGYSLASLYWWVRYFSIIHFK